MYLKFVFLVIIVFLRLIYYTYLGTEMTECLLNVLILGASIIDFFLFLALPGKATGIIGEWKAIRSGCQFSVRDIFEIY